jgi:type II secretory pathway pseudopilin PulG
MMMMMMIVIIIIIILPAVLIRRYNLHIFRRAKEGFEVTVERMFGDNISA